MENVRLEVSDFIALANQTLEFAYPTVEIVGEVQSFKINQSKYVFFDLKDAQSSISCFMMVFQLRTPLEDGMKVVVKAQPRLTKWGKFSLTVKHITLEGEGSIKRSFDMLVAKLSKEGMFDEDRKRPLPELPAHVGVISSTQSAGYQDFIKIINDRWGGLRVEVAHVHVQGEGAPKQIIHALSHFNQAAHPPEVIAIVRGGGSLDDLSAFNDEPLARAIASSRVPVITGIGHQTDTSLADMVADWRAATPSNVAERLVPDRREITARLNYRLQTSITNVRQSVAAREQWLKNAQQQLLHRLGVKQRSVEGAFTALRFTLNQLNPETVLRRGYSITRKLDGSLATAAVTPGQQLAIELKDAIIQAGVTNVSKKAKH